MICRIFYLSLALLFCLSLQGETLTPLSSNQPPQTHAELWAGYDPRAEPLDVEVLKEWEEEEIIFRVVRFRVGVFKGKKAMLAGVYGFPKGAENIPGLVNIHGGGQYADYKSVLTNAKRGYATITIAWAGRLSAPDYSVNPDVVKLFWAGDTDQPNYKVTTDWGALDAYHAPSRNGKDAFVSIPGKETWTFDPVPSPRNNSWFLCTMGARRALTFLEQQPEVDGSKLGVYGHSMGGKLTVQTAGSDSRVKAAAPSCGGISDRYNDNPLHRNCVGDSPALKNINCPVMFLKPSNDFHSHVNDLVTATDELGDNPWRIASSPHLNHRDDPEYEVATQLWFDQYLKGTFKWPAAPQTKVDLNHSSKIPMIQVTPDRSRKILAVDVYYTQQGHEGGAKDLRVNRMNRFWHHAKTTQQDQTWTAELPIFSTDNPIWAYANVTYALDQSISGAGYYYGTYTTDKFVNSSLIQLIRPDQLKQAGAKISLKPDLTIETFSDDWRKQWYSHNHSTWEIRTHKVYHPIWAAPKDATLQLEVRSKQANKMVVGIDNYATEIKTAGNDQWQTFTFQLSDFKDAENQSLTGWKDIAELRLLPAQHLRSKTKGGKSVTRPLGGSWQGDEPEFKKLSWQVSKPKAPANQILPTHKDVTYGDHPKQLINFWQADSDQPLGILLHIHGGGWMGGKKHETVRPHQLKQGYHLASISYPLVNQGAHQPAMLNSALRAVQFIRFKAKEWQIDPKRIVVKGESAGGCSSLLVAMHDDIINPQSSDPVEQFSSRVIGASVAGAQTTMNPHVIRENIGEKTFDNPMPYKPFGAETVQQLLDNWQQHEKLVNRCSPITHLTADDPPMYLFYNVNREYPTTSGGNGIHSPIFGELLQQASKKLGVTCHLQYWEKDRPKPPIDGQEFIKQLLTQ